MQRNSPTIQQLNAHIISRGFKHSAYRSRKRRSNLDNQQKENTAEYRLRMPRSPQLYQLQTQPPHSRPTGIPAA